MARAMVGLANLPGDHGHRATPKEWHSYFKFAVVRNPWARVYSWYKNAMRDPKHGVSPSDFPTFLREQQDSWALRPQTHWLKDFDGTIPLDRIVRFEHLEDEMYEVLGLLGFKDRTLPHVLNSGSEQTPDSYRAFYDSATVDLIAERYREEIDMFGYTF